MSKLKHYLLFLTALPVFAVAQDKDENLLDWKSSRKLTWSDYKGNPDGNSDAAASTTTYLGIEYKINEDGFSYKIQCLFSQSKSWGRSKTDFILKHEQGHFDIAELYARKLNKKMKEYKFNQKTFKQDVKAIYDNITSEKENFQDQYDLETDHSRKKDQQAEWNSKIEKLLEELKDYAGY